RRDGCGHPPGGGSLPARIEILTMPEFEHDERPQPERMVTSSGHVLADEPFDEPRLEVAALPRPRRQQHIGEEFPQIPTEPRTDRYGEALLAAVEDLGWQQTGRRLLQNVFAPAVPDL